MNTYKNWQIVNEDKIAWLRFDRAEKSTNTFNYEVLNELSDILTQLTKQANPPGIIIASNKTNGFIAGADVELFTTFKDSHDALSFILKGQEVFNQIADYPAATVAMINGFCMGGGTELALACRYRVADDSQKTKIGLPEILLGIHPGWGGTVRLPRLVGALNAMDIILSGRAVNGKAAQKMGFVDIAVPERDLKRAAQFYANKAPKPHRATQLQAITNHPLVRPWLAKLLRRKVAQKASPEHYPAPYAVINNWEKHGVDHVSAALKVEADSLASIAMTETARNLLRVFFLQDRLKGLAKSVVFKPKHVHVIGAGTMGGDIAAWCALRGMRVTLQDREPKFIAPAIKRAYDLYKKKLKAPRPIQAAMDNLIPDPQGFGIKNADVIIEAIFEDLTVKQTLFKTLEAQCKPDAILATNTSSIPLDEINTVLQHPERLVGIHFFNPVAMMQLVEVIKGKVTSGKVVDNALAFVRAIDRLPLPAKSSPGFLVNRVLTPYLFEAALMLEEGIAAARIDQAAEQFGMPMGPIELADTVGLDVCLAVAKKLSQYFPMKIPVKYEEMVNDKKLGRKTGEGFYHYRNGKPMKEKVGHDPQQQMITDRLILRMLNEAVACIREGVVSDSDLLDAGMIFGTGFAPFRGGPLFYAKKRGVNNIKMRLEELAQEYGERFMPDKGWENI